MNEKALRILEYNKIIEKLTDKCRYICSHSISKLAVWIIFEALPYYPI